LASFDLKFLDPLKASLKGFDWRSLKKLSNPQAAGDLNAFLEKLPQHAGNTMLILGGIAWAVAGATGLYVTVQMKQISELRNSLQEATALQPVVPIIKEDPVPPAEITAFVDKMGKIYSGVSIKGNGSTILVTAESTSSFGQFREAIGHIQNGGSGWRVNIERLCVGRECDKQPLAASFNISKISVEKPGE
jgi:hypothetical protein